MFEWFSQGFVASVTTGKCRDGTQKLSHGPCNILSPNYSDLSLSYVKVINTVSSKEILKYIYGDPIIDVFIHTVFMLIISLFTAYFDWNYIKIKPNHIFPFIYGFYQGDVFFTKMPGPNFIPSSALVVSLYWFLRLLCIKENLSIYHQLRVQLASIPVSCISLQLQLLEQTSSGCL